METQVDAPNGRDSLSKELRALREQIGRRMTDDAIVEAANHLLQQDYRTAEGKRREEQRRGGLQPVPFDPPTLIGSRRALNGWLNSGNLPSWEHLWAVARVLGRNLIPPQEPDAQRWKNLHANAASAPSLRRKKATPEADGAAVVSSSQLSAPRARSPWRRRILIGAAVIVLLVGAGVVVKMTVGPDIKANAAELPFTWTADLEDSAANAAMFRQNIQELGPPPPSGKFKSWAVARHGVPSGRYTNGKVASSISGYRLLLRARSSDVPVTITGINIEVVERLPAIVGTRASQILGGEKTGRWIDFDVDSDPPQALDSSNGDSLNPGMRSDPMVFPYQITTSDTELLLVEARTKDHYVKWRIRIEWSTGITSGEAVIDNGGNPYEVSAAGPGSSHCAIKPGGGAWEAGYPPGEDKLGTC
ncbi:hypothetical protein [Nocardia nova]|uniref:hypothetical protein n=1 Tax=Nocardia nova TaxID=37330 RepID=UPI001892FCC5|nr:hypothetical protein [Nocardia nova]MBF6150275.1 hypothetical protein [Nocardia nova]